MTKIYHEIFLSGSYFENFSIPFPMDRGYTKIKKDLEFDLL